MTKKSTKTVHYGNPNPMQLPRGKDGRFQPIKASSNQRRTYSNKKRRTVSISLTTPQHQMLEKISTAIGVSMRGFVCASTLMHLNKVAQELARQSGNIIE